MPIRPTGAGPVRPRITALSSLALLALAACPEVHREPTVPAPPPGCAQGRALCHAGAPWVYGSGERWCLADHRCDPPGARSCLAASPFRGPRHAYVPAIVCVYDDGAPLGEDVGSVPPEDTDTRVKVDDPNVSGAALAGGAR